MPLGLGCGPSKVWHVPPSPDELRPPSDRVNRAIVQVAAKWTEPGGGELNEERGGGIVLGYVKGDLHILTAAHVVRSSVNGRADSINVKFKHAPKVRFRAEVVVTHESEDLAVIRISEDLDQVEDMQLLRLPLAASPPQVGDSVRTISHPGANRWLNERATVTAVMGSEIAFSRGSIDGGSSGGAILSDDLKLLGMVTRVEADVAYGVAIGRVLQILDGWRIPYRSRLTGDVRASLATIYDAIWHDPGRIVGNRLPREQYDITPLFTATHNLFGGQALIVGDAESSGSPYYIEEVGSFYREVDRKDAWATVVHDLGEAVSNEPLAFGVSEAQDRLQFTYFKIGRGRIAIEVYALASFLYVIIYHNEAYSGPPPPTYVQSRLDDLRRASEHGIESDVANPR